MYILRFKVFGLKAYTSNIILRDIFVKAKTGIFNQIRRQDQSRKMDFRVFQ